MPTGMLRHTDIRVGRLARRPRKCERRRLRRCQGYKGDLLATILNHSYLTGKGGRAPPWSYASTPLLSRCVCSTNGVPPSKWINEVGGAAPPVAINPVRISSKMRLTGVTSVITWVSKNTPVWMSSPSKASLNSALANFLIYGICAGVSDGGSFSPVQPEGLSRKYVKSPAAARTCCEAGPRVPSKRSPVRHRVGATLLVQLARLPVHSGAVPTIASHRGLILRTAAPLSPLSHAASSWLATPAAGARFEVISKVDIDDHPSLQEGEGNLHPGIETPTGERHTPWQDVPIITKERIQDRLGDVVWITVPTGARFGARHVQGILADGYRT